MTEEALRGWRAARAGPAVLGDRRHRGRATASSWSTATAATTRSSCDRGGAGRERHRGRRPLHVAEGPQVIVDRVLIVGAVRTNPETIRARAAAAAGPAARLCRLGGEPGASGRARPVSPGHDRGGAARRRAAARRAGARRGVAGDDRGRRWRRRGRVPACVPTRTAPREERFEFVPRGFFEVGRRNLWGKNRAVNLFTRVSIRYRDVGLNEDGTPAPESTADRLRLQRVSRRRHLPRAACVRFQRRRAGHRHPGTGDPIQLQLRPPRAARRGRAAADAGLQLVGPLLVRADRDLRRTVHDQRRPGPHRPLVPAGPALDPLELVPPRHARRPGGCVARHADHDDGRSGDARHRLGGRLRQDLLRGSSRSGSCRRRGARCWRSARGWAWPTGSRGVGDRARPTMATPIVARVDDIPVSKRFFAGGDTTVRGFSLDRLGDESTISPQGFPTGGNGVVVLNGEMRVGVVGPLQAVGFVDAGNVVARASTLRLNELRTTAGFGVRYRSPVGPIRLDLGLQARSPRAVAGTARTPQRVAHLAWGRRFEGGAWTRHAIRCRAAWLAASGRGRRCRPGRAAAPRSRGRACERLAGVPVRRAGRGRVRADRRRGPTATRPSRWCGARCCWPR